MTTWLMFGLAAVACAAKNEYETGRLWPRRGERLATVGVAAVLVLGGPLAFGWVVWR